MLAPSHLLSLWKYFGGILCSTPWLPSVLKVRHPDDLAGLPLWEGLIMYVVDSVVTIT